MSQIGCLHDGKHRGDPDQEISGEVELVAIDASNTRTITMEARDEAGIDRIQIVDSSGADLTSQIATETLPQGIY